MTDVVRLKSLRKTYDGPVTALDGATIGFAAGRFTAVMEPSGSSKSTLPQCAGGLDRPTAVRVFIDGAELTATRDAATTKFRRRVAMARALVTGPAAIFADAPTGAPDPRSALLFPVIDRYGRTVVMATHDPVAASYADATVSRGSMS